MLKYASISFIEAKQKEFNFLFEQLDLSPCLSEMTVNDIGDCLKNDIVGLKATMISIYVHDINENNISGRVLATCELDELKSVREYRIEEIVEWNSLGFFSFRFFQWLLVIGSFFAIG